MGLSRQAAVAGAIREQKLLRQREAYLAAAKDVLAERRQLQHNAQVSRRREAAAEEATLRRRVLELRRQLAPRLEERRRKLKALLDSEHAQAEAALRQLQDSAATREKAIMQRATALKQKHDQERDREDERLLALRMKQEQGELRSQEYKQLVQEMLAANALQIASKQRQQQEKAEEENVFHALWTEGLNEKRLRDRRAIIANMKKAEETKAALLEQIAKREEKRKEELERIRIENEAEISRLQEEAEAATEQRRQQQAAAIQRRKEMDLFLAEQLKERNRQRLEDAELERRQLDTQAKMGLQAEDRARFIKEIEVNNAHHVRILMQQEKQRQLQELREFDSFCVREQLAEEERKELERAEADAARRQRARAVADECREQVKKREAIKAALEREKEVERAQVTAALEQYKASLRQERLSRLEAMQTYRDALDSQIAQRKLLKNTS
ncbi:uncharacterized protein EMH_0083350 [Eimeria mitis]|uniref:Uncharacterized protein n=1 Tax=Eimeria mitis TaxID=44415 RepID=U6JT67_9EIME|nr:uncharacterized protein EMH_0083350 [Eimeria mitis]CDJ27242.1 hypothetical protein, conserved [Eimeria mitis]